MSKETMKLALEALKKFVSTEWTEPFAEYRYDSDTPSENQFRDEVFTAIKALEEALAKQEQGEPVAWRNAAIRVGEDLCSVGPHGYYDMNAEQWLDWALSVVTVYLPPQQRTWFGLTDEEKKNIFLKWYGKHWAYTVQVQSVMDSVEAKLKEKNT